MRTPLAEVGSVSSEDRVGQSCEMWMGSPAFIVSGGYVLGLSWPWNWKSQFVTSIYKSSVEWPPFFRTDSHRQWTFVIISRSGKYVIARLMCNLCAMVQVCAGIRR
jgi:hypothetical protein